MSKPLSIVIVDDSDSFRANLKHYFSGMEDMNVVADATNGVDGYEQICRFKPDIVLMDVVMPRMDGLELLEKLSATRFDKQLVYIVLSTLGHDNITKRAMQLGAHYYIIKPLERLETLSKRIRQIYEAVNSEPGAEVFEIPPVSYSRTPKSRAGALPCLINEHNLERVITGLIHEVGIPAHIKGYTYLRDAIGLCIRDNHFINSITKQLYPTVAERNKTTSPRVERAIRHAIEVAWDRGDEAVLNEIFGYTIDTNRGKPTNGEFIALIADNIRIKMKDAI